MEWTRSNTQGTADLNWWSISISGDKAVAGVDAGGQIWYSIDAGRRWVGRYGTVLMPGVGGCHQLRQF
jgi:hypothetical protein